MLSSASQDAYPAGTMLHVRHESTSHRLEIVRVTSEPTIAVVLLTGSLDDGLALRRGDEAVLKLYDRRFMLNYRDHHERPGSQGNEQAYRDFVASGATLDPEADVYDCAESPGTFEAYLERRAQLKCDGEVSVYEHLRPLQGRQIPLFYAKVELVDPCLFPCPAILIEAITPSLSLHQLPLSTPAISTALLPGICDTAMDIMDLLSAYKIAHHDIKFDNLLVSLAEPFSDTAALAVLIDFAVCTVRKADAKWATEAAWYQEKMSTSEIDALGVLVTATPCRRVDRGERLLEV